jgi:hypothetical protein
VRYLPPFLREGKGREERERRGEGREGEREEKKEKEGRREKGKERKKPGCGKVQW